MDMLNSHGSSLCFLFQSAEILNCFIVFMTFNLNVYKQRGEIDCLVNFKVPYFLQEPYFDSL